MNKLRFRFMSSESWSTFCKIKRTLILCNSSRNNVWQKFISELQLLVVHINFVPLLNSISFISSVLANKSLWFTALSPFVYLPFVSFFLYVLTLNSVCSYLSRASSHLKPIICHSTCASTLFIVNRRVHICHIAWSQTTTCLNVTIHFCLLFPLYEMELCFALIH